MKKNSTNKDMNFQNMYIIFILGSFLGVVYEEIIAIVKYYHAHNIFKYRFRRGVIYGPFNPLYGAAIVFIVWLLGRKKRNPRKTFWWGFLLGGAIEYFVSLLMETILGVKSWDYSNRPFNINGRTTVLYMIFWGLATMVLVHYIFPLVIKWLNKIPKHFKKILVTCLVIFMTFDMLVSWTALLRQILRRNGYPPYTVIGRLYDKIYPDEFLQKIYNNMIFKE